MVNRTETQAVLVTQLSLLILARTKTDPMLIQREHMPQTTTNPFYVDQLSDFSRHFRSLRKFTHSSTCVLSTAVNRTILFDYDHVITAAADRFGWLDFQTLRKHLILLFL